jgi:O-antigen/teichoic acid export membrane protein
MKLARNIIWNAAGLALPVLVGVAVVPAIVRGLGTERFGFLSVIWMLIGYFSIFDLGLSRTLTKLVADRLATGREEEIASITATTLIVVTITSIVLSIVLALGAGWIAEHTLHGSPTLVLEGPAAIRFLSVSLPFVLLATVLTGLLEAYNRFALINAVRLPMGSLLLAAPLLVLPFSHHLAMVTAALAGLRILNAAVLAVITLRVVPELRAQPFIFRRELLRPLFTYGGWLSVSNVIGPLMVYFDRFLIAAVLGGEAIAYYTIPYDVLNRLLLFPTAIQGVLFPAFAMLHSQKAARIVSVFDRASITTMLLMLPPLLATMLLAHNGLELWVGPAIAAHSTLVAKILMVGVIFNAMARTPFVFVQGAGQARWTAILHLVELPFYAVALWLLLKANGMIEGAACAWTGRILVDTAALYAMSVRIEPRLRSTAIRDLLWLAAACLVAIALDWGLGQGAPRVAAMLIVGLVCAAILGAYAHGARPTLLRRSP